MTMTKTAAEFLADLPAALDLQSGTYINRDEVLARIRTEVNAALKAGVLPKGSKVSVRKLHYKSFRVEVTAWPGAVFSDAYIETLMDSSVRWNNRRCDQLAPELAAAVSFLETLAERHNYSNSRIEEDYFDVGYYLTVDARAVESHAMSAIMTEADPELAALQMRAGEAAKALGPACVKSVLGRGGVAAAGKWSLGRLIQIAERAGGRPVAYDKSRRGWYPVATPAAAVAA